MILFLFYYKAKTVAPRVGAWIEIETQLNQVKRLTESHPVWVRGLKSIRYFPIVRRDLGRTPCGCVD